MLPSNFMDNVYRVSLKKVNSWSSKMDDLSFSADFVQSLNTSTTQELLLNTISKSACKILNVERASVALIESDQLHFKVYSLTGNDAIPLSVIMPLKNTSVGEAVEGGFVQMVRNNLKSELGDSKKLGASGLHTHINVPLLVEDKVIGTLNIAAKEEGELGENEIFAAYIFTLFISSFFRNLNQLERINIQAIKEKELLEKNVENSNIYSLGQMAGGMAHEINNPLTITSGSIHLLKKRIKNKTLNNEYLLKKIDTIEEATKRVSNIISRLITISGDYSETDKDYFIVEDIILDVLDIFSERFKNKDVQLKLDFSNPLIKERVRGSRGQLTQVFLNLIENSYEAIGSLNNKWIRIDLEQDKDNFCIKVIDSGNGILEKNQGFIFNPFFTTKEIGKGMGLGLSSSKSIANNHGGDLVLDKSSKNTCFTISLPKK